LGKMRRAGQIGEDVLGTPGYLDAVHDRRHQASFVTISYRSFHTELLDQARAFIRVARRPSQSLGCRVDLLLTDSTRTGARPIMPPRPSRDGGGRTGSSKKTAGTQAGAQAARRPPGCANAVASFAPPR